ncbi:MAG TPA: FAD-binding oxidoreductase [Blastocatellia bacterium]|nr:FAD-binding oxidoreductase [Blastocatellia bacterium]
MSDREPELVRSIESVLGVQNVTQSPPLNLDAFAPSILALPGCAKEVAECLRICTTLKATAIPAGSMSWLDCGNPVRRADVVLSLKRMHRVVDYSPPDLTATVESGLLLVDFNALTRCERQWLALDPPGYSGSSIGAIAACNSSGPLRLGFGAPRDSVIGLRLAHADGTESRCGGRVVKNVAGYDMNKLYVGSYGTLAVITELTFKLRPLPDASATIAVTAKHRDLLLAFADRVVASELQPASIFLTIRLLDHRTGPGEDTALLIRFIDNAAAVQYQTDWIKRETGDELELAELFDVDAELLWQRVADIDRCAANTVRISVPISNVHSMLANLSIIGCPATVDLGLGLIRVAFDEDEEKAVDTITAMRSLAVESGGTLFVERAPLGVRQQVDVFGYTGDSYDLMKSLKAKFDPDSILNPGRFVAGI